MSTYIPTGYTCPEKDCNNACVHLIHMEGSDGIGVECCECGKVRRLQDVLADLRPYPAEPPERALADAAGRMRLDGKIYAAAPAPSRAQGDRIERAAAVLAPPLPATEPALTHEIHARSEKVEAILAEACPRCGCTELETHGMVRACRDCGLRFYPRAAPAPSRAQDVPPPEYAPCHGCWRYWGKEVPRCSARPERVAIGEPCSDLRPIKAHPADCRVCAAPSGFREGT